MRRSSTIIMAIAAVLAPVHDAKSQSLVLTEVETVAVTDIRSPAASVGANHCLLIWDESAHGPFIRWCGARTDTVGWHPRGIIAAAWKDGRVVAFDSTYALRTFRDTVAAEPQRIGSLVRPIGATIHDGRWHVLDAMGGDSARVVSGAGPVPDSATLPLEIGVSSKAGRQYHVRVYPGEYILTAIHPPFSSYRVPRQEGRVSQFHPGRASKRNLDRGDFQNWMSLPTLQLGRFYVQVLADLRSDSRLLVRYDAAGVEQSVRVIEAPFGLQLSSPDSTAVGSRDLGSHVELVRYQWRWSSSINDEIKRRQLRP